ncbi:ribosomal protein L15 [Kipferlia bialata]|uniref:Ribosomal protein L15 n=1 Tax=Kipferlia bialata TaxID=797122 RepID=A0A391NJU2_9EUKA|nr:ribosomal protein L15 [Kipferlia bialata]|eukprot:g1964.t1
MPTAHSHSRKKRGHVSAGHGRVGKHRKHSSGRGKAGGFHHMRINFDKYHPGVFGKNGMRHFHQRAGEDFCKTINVDRIWALIPEDQRAELIKNSTAENCPVIDLNRWGITKVLGRGQLPACPIIIKARFVTAEAEQKIKAAGGVVVLKA